MREQNAYCKKNRNGTADTAVGKSVQSRFVAQFYIFKDEDFLGWDCFYKGKVRIGCGRRADVILHGDDISDNHAVVYFKGGKIIVSDRSKKGGVFVNNLKVKTVILGRFDYIDIGPYTIKIKCKENKSRLSDHEKKEHNKTCHTETAEKKSAVHKKIEKKTFPEKTEGDSEKTSKKDETGNAPFREKHDQYNAVPETHESKHEKECDTQRHRLVFQGEISDKFSIEEVENNLVECLKTDADKINWLYSETPVVINENLDHWSALQLGGRLEEAGAKVKIEKIEKIEKSVDDIELSTPGPDEKAAISERKKEIIPTKTDTNYKDDEEDEEDGEDREALFSLKEKIFERKHKKSAHDSGKCVFEIIKFKNDSVIDVCFLKPKEKYFIPNGKRKFLLAENKETGKCLFYYNDQISGNIREGDAAVKRTDDLKNSDTLHNKRKGIYRNFVKKGCEVTIYDGIFGYLLRPAPEGQTSEIQLPEKEEKIFHKYLIKSSIIHLIFLIFIGLFHSVKKPEPLLPETHFVKIDRSFLSEMKKKTTPVPVPVVKQEKMELKPEKKSIARNQKNKSIKVASKKRGKKRKRVASRHPKAGGGFGKGNIKNRNINQTGLLSMLGDSVGIAPQTAMAAVTNLDAVSSVRPSNAGFKVGGIVGKLGDAKIALPKNGIVSTKGSSQVLRSSGARGKGRIAALEKGKTGQKQVQGMVSAKLNKTVSVQGGMSREAVKRVIDQHLDEISYCYETALIANPSIMGKVIFEWRILTSGKVGMVQIKSSSINSSEIHSCIKTAIKTWQFPKPRGSEVIVSYPFVFDIVGF